MGDLDWIKSRLPSDHGLSDASITARLATGANRISILADLLEELASQDRFDNVSVGGLSVSNPNLFKRAAYWRAMVPGAAGDGRSLLSFVPIKKASNPYATDELG